MTLGTNIRATITNLINNPNLRSEITVTPITVTRGDYGGYDSNTRTEGTARTVYCIPSNNTNPFVQALKLGRVESGNMRLIIAYNETINTQDTITWQGDVYDVDSIKPTPFNNVMVAQTLTLKRRIA